MSKPKTTITKPSTKPAAAKPAAAPRASSAETLLGSSTLASQFTIGGKEVTLGAMVTEAHKRSGLSVEEWNALSAEDRDGHLNALKAVLETEAAAAEKPSVHDLAVALGAHLNAFAAEHGMSTDEIITFARTFLGVKNTPRAEADQGGSGNPAAPAKGFTRIKVTGPQSGRWRIGRQFTAETSAPFDVTGEQLAAIEADPLLSHEVVQG